ncbi:acetyl-CoA carboxylase biotin carboxyl carrier protein subunit [Chitinimonas arctica]|uniref:acetyl-CoA carboxylase biotin carboxyl carrier protein subunit n=1 Tax=Chitinimonas arctica TaxID=2594795 RepID=UPI00402BD010
MALAALAELALLEAQVGIARDRSNDADSPWWHTDGWRLNQDNRHALHFRCGEDEHAVIAHYQDDAYLLEIGGDRLVAHGTLDGHRLDATLDGYRLAVSVVRQADTLTLVHDGRNTVLHPFNPLLAGLEAAEAGGGLTAPMPGTVVAVHVRTGDTVEKGQPLMILEAMKMEHTILAPQAGQVAEVFFQKGEQVKEGAALLEIAAAAA